MVLGINSSEKITIWHTIYPNGFVDVFKGKKQENILNLLGTMSILGESQTSDISKYVLSYGKTDGYIFELRYQDYASLQNEYSRLLSGRLIYQHGGKKIKDQQTDELKKYPNPIDLGYVIITDKPKNTKGNPTPQYFLTLKGFFLIMGYHVKQSDLKSIIENASKISLFFCFIKTVMENTTIDFVTEIFINPIQKVLLRTDIFTGGDLNFYFGNIVDAISESLSKKMKMINDDRKQDILDRPKSYFEEKITREYMQLHSTRTFSDLVRIKQMEELQDVDNLIHHFKMKGIESLMNSVFYSSSLKEDWYDSLFDHFYPSEESKKLFLKFGYDSEKKLMSKVMQSISLTYSSFEYGLLPYTEKKLPRSKAWKRHQKFKKPDKALIKKYGLKPVKEFDISNLD
jgi:hypothetical protein